MQASMHGSMHASMDGSMHGSMDGSMHGSIIFVVPKEIHYTPTGDNPHAACPSRPRWGVRGGVAPPGRPPLYTPFKGTPKGRLRDALVHKEYVQSDL